MGFGQRISIPLDSANDFSIGISSSVTAIISRPGNPTLTFCSNNVDFYTFMITTDGKCLIGVTKDGKLSTIGGGVSKFIKQGMYAVNKLRVDKKDKNWEFYINDSLLYTMPAGKYFGHEVGFAWGEDTNIEFDDFKVTGTPMIHTLKFCTLLPAICESGEDKFSYIMGKEAPKVNNKYQISQTYYPTYFSLINLENDSSAYIQFESTSRPSFGSVLKKCKTKNEAQLQLKKIFTELKKCMPADYYVYDLDEYLLISKKASVRNVNARIKAEANYNESYKIVGYNVTLAIQ